MLLKFLKLLLISLKNRKENSKWHKVQAVRREAIAAEVITLCQEVGCFKRRWIRAVRERWVEFCSTECGGEHFWAGYRMSKGISRLENQELVRKTTICLIWLEPGVCDRGQ